jgi:hypothetical protein
MHPWYPTALEEPCIDIIVDFLAWLWDRARNQITRTVAHLVCIIPLLSPILLAPLAF